MKLPRYSSTALPTQDTLSPQEAAAAAAAKGEAYGQIAGTVSDFAWKMMQAEDQSKAREQLADQAIKLSEFENDTRWEQDEIDGRPTEQVMLEEYSKLESDMAIMGGDIQQKAVREQVEIQSEGALVDARLKAEAIGNSVRIRRTKARDAMTMDKLQRAGNFDASAQTVLDGYETGMYTMGERDALLEQNDKLKRLDPYFSTIGSDNVNELNSKALEALDDPTLRAAEKIDMWRTLSSAADAEEARYYNERARRWNDNSVAVWKNFDALSTDDIVASDVSPETKRSALLMKRSDAQAGLSVIDDPGAKQQVYELISEMSEGRQKHSYVTEIIAGYAKSGQLSFETAIKLQQDAITYSDKVFAGAQFNDIASLGYNMITRGVPSDALFEFYKEKKGAKLAQLANEWKTALVEAKIEQGPSFDPRQWYEENVDSFRNRADLIQNEAKQKKNLADLRMEYSTNGKPDQTAIIEYMENSGTYSEEEIRENILNMSRW